jgi:hypothetical protein
MSIEDWVRNGWLVEHRTSPQEIQEQLESADQDLRDAGGDLSPGWQFAIAYNAALRLGTVLLYASGFRAVRQQKHFRTIAAIALLLGPEHEELVLFLDRCRSKRSEVTYESVHAVAPSEVDALKVTVRELRRLVYDWLRANRPELLPGDE